MKKILSTLIASIILVFAAMPAVAFAVASPAERLREHRDAVRQNVELRKAELQDREASFEQKKNALIQIIRLYIDRLEKLAEYLETETESSDTAIESINNLIVAFTENLEDYEVAATMEELREAHAVAKGKNESLTASVKTELSGARTAHVLDQVVKILKGTIERDQVIQEKIAKFEEAGLPTASLEAEFAEYQNQLSAAQIFYDELTGRSDVSKEDLEDLKALIRGAKKAFHEVIRIAKSLVKDYREREISPSFSRKQLPITNGEEIE